MLWAYMAVYSNLTYSRIWFISLFGKIFISERQTPTHSFTETEAEPCMFLLCSGGGCSFGQTWDGTRKHDNQVLQCPGLQISFPV